MNNEIKKAVEILNKGGIVVFPTDTVYGVGCRIDNEKAVKKLFKIRKRPAAQAFPVLVSGIPQAKKYFLNCPREIENLMKKYWPGALTIVYKCKNKIIPKLVRGGGGTIGLRMPNHKIPLEIIKNVSVPLLGPSANFHKYPTPKNFSELDPEFIKLVDFVIKGEVKLGISSTVLDCTQKPYKIIRQGGVVLDEKDLKIRKSSRSHRQRSKKMPY